MTFYEELPENSPNFFILSSPFPEYAAQLLLSGLRMSGSFIEAETMIYTTVHKSLRHLQPARLQKVEINFYN